MSPLRVLRADGGASRHVEPALALADALRRTGPAVSVTAPGTGRGVESAGLAVRHGAGTGGRG
jgi:UDP-N-acetylglucosamine--N-acetylmuramyl-(pentapeptide) pyrophosphoryl-undecaprenol N-acetylglucosamine transferase